MPFVYVLDSTATNSFTLGLKKDEVILEDFMEYQDEKFVVISLVLATGLETGFNYRFKITDINRKFDDLIREDELYHQSEEKGTVSDVQLICTGSQNITFCENVLSKCLQNAET